MVFTTGAGAVQVYVRPPDAVSVIELPKQTVGVGGVKAIVGDGATSFTMAKVDPQPVMLLPVTE